MPATHYEASPLRRDAERGAVLIHVVVAMIGLLGFSGFVIDYGILWSARRQAQNSADAAAIAAATSLGYVDYLDQGRARDAAIAAATNSAVWGEPPHITDADVTFPACPTGAPGPTAYACAPMSIETRITTTPCRRSSPSWSA